MESCSVFAALYLDYDSCISSSIARVNEMNERHSVESKEDRLTTDLGRKRKRRGQWIQSMSQWPCPRSSQTQRVASDIGTCGCNS